MAFLSRIFRKDPRQILQKAEAWLAEGKGVRALHAAEDLARRAEGRARDEAEDLVRRAHRAIMNRALEEAKVSKEIGEWEEAADWLGTALEHCQEEGQKSEIEGLKEALLTRARQAEAEALRMEATGDEGAMADGEIAYEMLMGVFTPEMAELYNGRPAALREAVVAFHNGSPEEALGILEELLQESPEDPVYRLEAGQCRLVLGQAEAALRDFEAVGDALGEECLDVSERVSVPILLASAMLDVGRAGDLLERFEGKIDVEEDPQALGVLWARALAETGRREEAVKNYVILGNRFPGDPELALEASPSLARGGARSGSHRPAGAGRGALLLHRKLQQAGAISAGGAFSHLPVPGGRQESTASR